MTWLERFSNLFRGEALGRALDEELDFHLEARIGENIRAGMSPQEAERDARRRFGNRTLAKERSREMDIVAGLETVGQDVRYALRSLRRSPGFTATAVLALALGVGANTAVFTVVNGVLLRPLPFPEAQRLTLISYRPTRGPFHYQPSMADAHYVAFRRQNQAYERTATFAGETMTLTGAGDPVRLQAAAVTPDFFPTLRVNASLGRTFLADEDQKGSDQVALLSDTLWRSRFGADANVLGKTIVVDGARRKVVGVMPPGFAFGLGSPRDAGLWTPLNAAPDGHNSFSRPVVGRLKPGVTPQQAKAELDAWVRGLPAERGRDGMLAETLPLKDLLVGDIRSSLLIFAGAVAFVLLIACANVANLLLMRAASRQQEIGVRGALGASRWRLIRQLLTESLLVSLAGGTAGLALAALGVRLLLRMAPAGKIPRLPEIHIDGWVLAFTFGVVALTGIAFGLAPAFQATRRSLRAGLTAGGRTNTARGEGLRGALVVLEIAMALVLLTGAGLMLKSFVRMRSVNPGFRAENVLTMTVDLPDSVYRTPNELKAFHALTLDKLASLPGVVAVGAVNWMPFAGALVTGDFQIEGRPRSSHGWADKPGVSPGYFRAVGIPLLKGRYFTERDSASAPGVVIVSQSVGQRLWPGEDPIGKRISMEDHPKPEDWLTIVGVVDDIRQSDLKLKPSATVYQPYTQVPRAGFLSHMSFLVRTAANPQSLAPAFRAVLKEVDRDQPVESVAAMEDVVGAAVAEPRFQGRLLAVFAALALALSVIGIYGVQSYSVAERTHEIGIRMALGAPQNAVLRMVLRRTLGLAAAGVALGTAGALAVTGVIGKFLFQVTPTDPATFAAVAAVLAASAVLAALLPARRAAKVDPMITLRCQ
ncbi:MAG TPA: ABC transporter permease [Candidatus Acidoferrales bacterium]|nr:ABC transporter permease [Candidatus Acidoferrales bacterium]